MKLSGEPPEEGHAGLDGTDTQIALVGWHPMLRDLRMNDFA